MQRTVKIRDLTPFITCRLCNGYLIEATTITECIHSFCRSCIVKHLQDNNFCPICKTVIHHSYPLNYISTDRTMQDVVYKLVPGLQERELQRQNEFEVAMFMFQTGKQQKAYNELQAKKNRSTRMDERDIPSTSSSASSTHEDERTDYHRNDEQVAVCMECHRQSSGKRALKQLHRKYLRLSSQATVMHLKKFLARKLDLSDYKDVEILCNDEILGKDHTLKFICVTRWRFKNSPLLLHYRPSLKLY